MEPDVVIVPVMSGVTTAIVAFLLLCFALPQLVKHRPQFYGAMACAVGILLLHTLSVMIGSAGFQVFAGAISGLLQIAALLLLFLACGGLTPRELAADMARAYEVIRRGQQEHEIIIPPPPAAPGAGGPPPAAPAASGGPAQPQTPPPAAAKPPDTSSIPLE